MISTRPAMVPAGVGGTSLVARGRGIHAALPAPCTLTPAVARAVAVRPIAPPGPDSITIATVTAVRAVRAVRAVGTDRSHDVRIRDAVGGGRGVRFGPGALGVGFRRARTRF